MSGVGLYAVGLGLGVGLSIIGAGYGIGIIARSALESTGRQPEASGDIFLQMIVAAALIEGFTFFGILVFYNGIGKVNSVGPETSESSHAQLNKPEVRKSVDEIS